MTEVDKFNYDIAVIGMAGRFPKAGNLEQYWKNLRDGIESISFFSEEEMEAAGVSREMLGDPNYVRAGAALEDVEMFDASFFGFNPREAELMDPQHRIFLEQAWEAMENAGYDSKTCKVRIGVYAGSSMSSYLINNLLPNRDLLESTGIYQVAIGNNSDYLATNVSYKLNLRGPSFTVQTACSTSLVAIHLACQSLLNHECDMALAGGASVKVPQNKGYLYQDGGILSPDGHCRAFDAQSQGTVGGSGVGVVLLKRLSDAIADGDFIHAVVKGSAINNDGSQKIGFTAPGVDGQAAVIEEALAMSAVDPESISYVETHGTATSLGDPIEIAALTQAYRNSTDKKGFCAIGSVKTNIGHLDAAAGAAGFIKTALALKEKMLPPSLHYKQPNPKIDFANSPFYVNSELREWKADRGQRRAGVSSFGIGGTNAHVILEEAPELGRSDRARTGHLIVLSAKTDTALDAARTNLIQYLKQHRETSLADISYTLQVGRAAFNHRLISVCSDIDDAIEALESEKRFSKNLQERHDRPVVFMFSGQGSQYVNMGLDLYKTEPSFKAQVDHCSEILKPHMGLDLRDLLYPAPEKIKWASEQLKQTCNTQPALFVIEYALAKLLMEWGFTPEAMIGHSIGEYVAACLSRVLSLEDALSLVAARGRLMQQMPGGSMIAVPLSEQDLKPYIENDGDLSLAAINGPALCVVSGTDDAILLLEERLDRDGISCKRLHTSHAFHSQMMEPILEQFIERVKNIKLNAPRIPYISNVTGTWMTATDAMDPDYWARQLRQAVRFADGIAKLQQEPERIFLEVGPGHALSSTVKQYRNRGAKQVVLSAMRHSQDQQSDLLFLLNTLGQLWLSGATIDWQAFHAGYGRRRMPLPTYPFERKRYWIEPRSESSSVGAKQDLSAKRSDTADGLFIPSWKRSILAETPTRKDQEGQKSCWLVFSDSWQLDNQIISRLTQPDTEIITVIAAESFTKIDENLYTINPGSRDDYDLLIKEIRAFNMVPTNIIHLWSLTAIDNPPSEDKPDTDFAAPGNEIEQLTADVWQELLGIDRIGIHDNYFNLGGTSLLAIQIVSKLREIFKLELPLDRLFEVPTIAGVSAVIAEGLNEQKELEEMERLLKEIEGLSIDDIHLQLGELQETN